jgi:hypothetical protein
MGITTAGKRAVAQMIGGVGTVADFDYLALGDSDTAFAVGQTALISEITGNGLARAQDSTPTEAAAVLSIDYTWTASGAETLKEVGLLNAPSGGTLLGRTVLASSVSMVNNATYKYTYTITVS